MAKHIDIIRAPLQQAMIALWLAGAAHLVLRLSEGDTGPGWAGSAWLGALALCLFAARFRRPAPLCIAVLLGAAAWLAVLPPPGGTGALAAALALYAFSAWLAARWALHQPLTTTLAAAFGLRGGYGPGGGRHLVETTVHRTALALSLVAVGLAAPLLLEPDPVRVGSTVPVFALAALHFGFAAGRYQRRLYARWVLVLATLATLAIYVTAHSALGLPARSSGPGLDVLLVSLGLSCSVGMAIREATGRTGAPAAPLAFDLYHLPLLQHAMALVILALGLDLGRLAADPAHAIGAGTLVVLALGGCALLWANRWLGRFPLDLCGLLLWVLAVLAAEHRWWHGPRGFSLIATDPGLGERWVWLALISLALGCASNRLATATSRAIRYREPLDVAAGVSFGWALASGLCLAVAAPWASAPHLPWIWLALAAALLALRWPIPNGHLARVQGLGLGLLLSAAVSFVLVAVGAAGWAPALSFAWAYGLWLTAEHGLPRAGRRWSSVDLDARAWPWLGVAFVLAGVALAADTPAAFGAGLLAASGYLALMLRHSACAVFPWASVWALGGAGVAFNIAAVEMILPAASWSATASLALIGIAAWAGMLGFCAENWRTHGAAVAAWLGWRRHDLIGPLASVYYLLVGIGVAGLAALSARAIAVDFPSVSPEHGAALLVASLLLAPSLRHGPAMRSPGLIQHLRLCAFSGAWFGAYQICFADLFHPPLLVILWSVAPYFWLRHLGRQAPSRATLPLQQVLGGWQAASTVAAAAMLVAYAEIAYGERLLTLALVATGCWVLACTRETRGWRRAALSLTVLFLHAWPFLWIPRGDAPALLPWYALLFALLPWALVVVRRHLSARSEASTRSMWSRLDALLATLQRASVATAGAEWLLHLWAYALPDVLALHPAASRWDPLAMLTAGALLLTYVLWCVRRSPQSPWIYVISGLALGQGLYLRLLLLGLAAPTPWDTAALLLASYGLVILQHRNASRPILHLAYLVPILALLTVPLQLGSAHASLALLATASVYLAIRHSTRRPLPLYLAALGMNLAIYVWVPGWAERSDLLQVYLFPAALSVLVLLHLHQRELRPSVLNSARLGAIATLYASATADVFLRPELGVFVLALVLGLAGIGFGIALRVRALLYSGVSFLVLNVLGQLLRFYPEHRLGKALVLMSTGAAITAAMVCFNMKREAIRARLSGVRADLASWD